MERRLEMAGGWMASQGSSDVIVVAGGGRRMRRRRTTPRNPTPGRCCLTSRRQLAAHACGVGYPGWAADALSLANGLPSSRRPFRSGVLDAQQPKHWSGTLLAITVSLIVGGLAVNSPPPWALLAVSAF